MQTNPLLEKTFYIQFDKIKPEHVVPAVDLLIEKAKQKLEDLVNSNPEKRTFENTILAYEAITEELEYAQGIVVHLKSVDNNPEIVNAHQKISPRITSFASNLFLNDKLYGVIKEYAQSQEAQQLQGPRKRFLNNILDTFVKNGAELDTNGKQRLEKIEVELDELCNKFGQNVLESTNAYSLLIKDESRLAGMPDSAKQAAKERAQKKNEEGWMFTLHAPSMTPVMSYADDRELRKEIYLASSRLASSGEKDNRENIVKILTLRKEKAELLGFKDFADYILEDRMAKNGSNAISFLEGIREKVKPHFNREHAELLEFYYQLEGENAPELEAWDLAYYAEKQRKQKYDFDMEQLRPYFSFENVLNGVFDLVNRLYGVTVKPAKDIVPWKGAEVRTYSIFDSDDTWIGSFYMDYFPRGEKRSGAWMNFLYAGGPKKDGSFQPHLALNCGNLTPPTNDKPSLLLPGEAKTIFHEFGHLMHQILSAAEIRTQSGPDKVSWDFVEFPSQLMENWLHENEVLENIAHHYETGEKIPAELLAKKKNAENYRSASFLMRQLTFGLMDLNLHTAYDHERDGNVVEYCRNFMQDFVHYKLQQGYSIVTAFQHIFSDPTGYAAAYYSYMWASAYEADAFTKFQAQGIYSRKLGTELRNKILAYGSSEDPEMLFKDFMDRELDSSALLKRSGLL